MKYLVSLFILISLFQSCSGNKNKPDIERDDLLKEKKERHGNNVSLKEAKDTSKLVIKFTPYVPNYPGLGSEGVSLIESKLVSIVSRYGNTGNFSNPTFAIIPAINIVSKNVTSTAPTMFVNTYEVNFYTVNMHDGSIFSSSSFTINGVGQSSLKAFINAIQSNAFNGVQFGQLLKEGEHNALKYYDDNCDKIIAQAKNEEVQKNYSNAFLILKTIPESVNCFTNSNQLLQEVFQKKMSSECNDMMAHMKAELGKQSEIGGFNNKAMSFYAMITPDVPCYKEAQQIYNNYLKKLDPKAKQKWEQDEREFNLRKNKQDQDHEYEMTKAELESKTAIEGQTELLNKYKKDFEYDKLPWLRKLVHLGEWDPFDATSRINRK